MIGLQKMDIYTSGFIVLINWDLQIRIIRVTKSEIYEVLRNKMTKMKEEHCSMWSRQYQGDKLITIPFESTSNNVK